MATTRSTGRQVTSEVRRATDRPWFRAVARSGFAASGLVQLLVGVLAIQVALHRTSTETDQSGALHDLASAPGGEVVLWLAAIGSLALTAWLLVSGLLQRDADAKQTWAKRARDWGKAVVYLAIGVTALRVALGAATSSASSSRRGSATVLQLPGGPLLLALVGFVVLALGVALVAQGVTKRFLKTIRVPAGTSGRVIVLLGQVGYAARGVAIAVVGVLFVVAAFTLDPQKASGLDGALKSFAGLPFGRVVLIAIGIGWIASGIYSAIRAKLAKL